MSAYEVCDAVLKGLDEGFDFIVVNFANGDMVGHTGDIDAATKAVEAVDSCLGKIIQMATNTYKSATMATARHCAQLAAKCLQIILLLMYFALCLLAMVED